MMLLVSAPAIVATRMARHDISTSLRMFNPIMTRRMLFANHVLQKSKTRYKQAASGLTACSLQFKVETIYGVFNLKNSWGPATGAGNE